MKRFFIILVVVTVSAFGVFGEDVLPGFIQKSTLSETLQYSLKAYYEIKPELGSWSIIGPFAQTNCPVSTDKAPDMSAKYNGVDGKEVSWQKVPDGLVEESIPLTKGNLMELTTKRREYFNELIPKDVKESQVFILWRNIGCSCDQSMPVEIQDRYTAASLFLNGEHEKLSDGDRRRTSLSLKKGVNSLYAKITYDSKSRYLDQFIIYPFIPGREHLDELSNRAYGKFGGEPEEARMEYVRIFENIDTARSSNPLVQERNRLLESQVQRMDAMILKGDRDPLDVVLRRSRALLDNLQKLPGAPVKLKELSANLDDIRKRSEPVAIDVPERWGLFKEACELKRKIAFANPLLDFEKLVFLKRPKSANGHMCDQYFGFHAQPVGGLYVLEDPFGTPVEKDVLKDAVISNGRLKGKSLAGGAFLSLELDYDAKTVLFAWTEAKRFNEFVHKDGYQQYIWKPESTFHIFRADIDPEKGATNVVQLTDGAWNDFDPCFLPNGRIVFISERRGGFGRCHGRPVPTYTLHSMMPDGSDIITLSYHETNEWHPSVDNNGMIIYTRWDYVDRDDELHSLWLAYPDGRDPRSYHGNYPEVRESRPWMEMTVRAIPGSGKYMGTAVGHHSPAYGPLVIIDQRIEDDGAMSQVKRVNPYIPFPEAESGQQTEQFGTPWPLSEDYSLAVHDRKCWNYGIYLVDSFGNRELVYRDPRIACIDPIPLRPRQRPPIIPSMTTQAKADKVEGEEQKATIAVMNVYDADFKWPEGARITDLRIIQFFPKTTYHGNEPNVGAGSQALARGILGTVPVEEDGSAYFEAPAGVPIAFQALNGKGLAVQNMRSATYVHSGERLVCQGCHEPKHRMVSSPSDKVRMAMKRPPSKIKKEVAGSWPVFYPVLVQDVLDRNCLECHEKSGKKGAPCLRGMDEKKLNGDLPASGEKYNSFHSLTRFSMYFNGGNGTIMLDQFRGGGSRSVAGKIGALGSPLYHMLAKGHNNLKLSDEDMHRLVLWMDTSCMFYGDYNELKTQYSGKVVLPKVF